MKLSILVPVYNERPIFRSFWESLKTAPFNKLPEIKAIELILVDDGSTDGTSELIAELVKGRLTFPGGNVADVRLLRQPKNSGKGAAIVRAVKESTGDIILIQDADMEYSPSDYPALISPMFDSGADAVFGSRFTGSPRRVLFFWHSMMNHLLTLISNMFFNLNLTDMETGFKVIRGNLARSLNLRSKRFGIEPELTARLAGARAVIYEVPISYRGRTYAEGKKIRARDGVAAIWHLLRLATLDREAFKPGVGQALHVLRRNYSAFYTPLLEKALGRPSSDKRSRILEIGCGVGALTPALLKRGSVIASDISPEFLRVTKRSLAIYSDLDTKVWDASKAPWKGAGKFDLIVSFNVLEHIEKDVDALKTWSGLLNEGGKICILVPNNPQLFCKLDESVGHFRRYSRNELIEKMQQAGFTVDRAFYGNALGILGWVIQGLFLKRDTLSSSQIRLYSLLKPLIRIIERPLESFTGLSLVVMCTVPTAQKQPSLRRMKHAA